MAAFHLRLALVMLSIPYESVASALSVYEAVWNSASRRNLLSPDHSRIFISDVVGTLSAISKHTSLQLKILYDQQHSGSVNDIANLYDGMRSVRMSNYDGTKVPLRQLLTKDSRPSLLLALCTSQNIVRIFQEIQRQRLENYFMRWLIMSESDGAGDAIVAGLKGLVHEGNHVSLMLKGKNNVFIIFSSRLDSSGVMSFYEEGKSDIRTPAGRNRLPELVIQDDRKLYMNMKGRELKVAVVSNYGLCTLGEEYPDGSVEAISGTDISTVRALSQALNFTFRAVYPPDRTYGNPLPNGTVTGMVGMASRREVAFSTCSIAISNLRETAVDFAYPYVRGSLGIFTRAPKQKNRALAVLSPFTLEVWLCIIASTLAVGPLISLQSKASAFDVEGKHQWNLQWYAFNMFRSFVIQGNRIKTRQTSQRIVLFAWFLFCLIVSALYSGMLTAVLAIPEYETPVNSLTDLPRVIGEGFTLGVLKDSANEYLFKKATGGIYKETWDLFNHDDRSQSFVDGNSSGMKRVLERAYIYIGFKLVCEILATRLGRSKIHVARETLFDHSLSIALPPGAPYQKIFSEKLMKMVEGGLITKWKDEEIIKISKGGASEEGEKSRTYAITLTHLQAAFFVIVLGCLSATIVLVFENVVWYIQE